MDKIKFAVIVIIITIFVNGINCDSDCDCKSIKELQEFMKKDLYENKFEISKMNSRLRRLETSMRSFTKTNNKAPSTESGGELSTSGVNSNENKGLGSIESLEAKITAIASLLKIDDEISTDVTKTKTGITSGILDKIETKVTSLSLQVQDLKKTNAVLGKVVAKTLSAEKGSRKRFESVFTNAVENINNSVSDMKIETESLIDKNSDKLIERFDKSFKMMKDNTVNINQTLNEEINILTDSVHSLTEEWSGANKNVDGQWAKWSSWTSCDVTCGNGRQLRTRRCTNPMPKNKGKDCIGESLQSKQCSNESCTVDGQWANWSSWTSCDVTCGNGRQLRTRRCKNPMPENKGKDCIGESLQSNQCSKERCRVDGQWAKWSSWTSCDVTCGSGRQLRTRRCTNPMPENKGKDCIGESLQSKQCSKERCRVDGQWANWSSWTSCDVTCGNGRQLRTRRCTNPMPENKGRDCIGESLQSNQCSKERCRAFMSAFSVESPKTYGRINRVNKLTFSNTIYQYGNDFSISTGTYTCSKSGVYHFSVTLVKKRSSSRLDWVYCSLYKNWKSLTYIRVDPTDDDTDKGNAAISQSIVINLNVGDTVYLTACSYPPSKYMAHWSTFTGFFLYDNN